MLDENVKAINVREPEGPLQGGTVKGMGVDIRWQDGPLGRGEDRKEPNGAFVETVIWSVIKRLEFYQDSKFKCRENALAITKLEEALHWLYARSVRRELQEVEGTNEGN